MSDSIHVLMSRVMKDIKAIGKDQKNPHFNYNFRGIDDVFNAFHGPLTKHGVFYVPKIASLSSNPTTSGKMMHAKVRVRYRFYGPQGDYVDGEGAGEGLDNGDKATTKALQSALKYALLATFCIPTEEQRETDADGHSPSIEEQPKRSGQRSAKVTGAGTSATRQVPKAVSETSDPTASPSERSESGAGSRGSDTQTADADGASTAPDPEYLFEHPMAKG